MRLIEITTLLNRGWKHTRGDARAKRPFLFTFLSFSFSGKFTSEAPVNHDELKADISKAVASYLYSLLLPLFPAPSSSLAWMSVINIGKPLYMISYTNGKEASGIVQPPIRQHANLSRICITISPTIIDDLAPRPVTRAIACR